jgi:hypothetical protein
MQARSESAMERAGRQMGKQLQQYSDPGAMSEEDEPKKRKRK